MQLLNSQSLRAWLFASPEVATRLLLRYIGQTNSLKLVGIELQPDFFRLFLNMMTPPRCRHWSHPFEEELLRQCTEMAFENSHSNWCVSKLNKVFLQTD